MNEIYKQKCQKCGAQYTIDGAPLWQLGLCVQLMRTHPDFFSAINKDKRDLFMDGIKTALEYIKIEYSIEQVRTINEHTYALGVPVSISLSKEKQREVL